LAINFFQRASILANPSFRNITEKHEFEFIIKLKAAKQIGVTIPPEVFARANRLIT